MEPIIRASHEYSMQIEESHAGNEVLFWEAVAKGVARMAQFCAKPVAVGFNGEPGRRIAYLNGTRCEDIK